MIPKIGIVKGYKFENYKNAIEKHGGEIKKLLVNGEQAVDEYIDQIHGILLPGGADINIDKRKDKFEKALFRKAMEKNMPVFGICRGIQIMNVAMGGSLYQDIPTEVGEHLTYEIPEKSDDPWHKIKIQPDSGLNRITHESITEVTSSHHQAVKVIAEGLVGTAHSEDGIIEAMELPSKRFAIGVQYHPERMWIDNRPTLPNREFYTHAKNLFEEFIDAADKYRILCKTTG